MRDRKRNPERGAAAAIVALMLPVLVGGFGLVIDAGQAYDLKQRLQKVADAAALSAAHELRRGNDVGLVEVALRDAERNYLSLSNATIRVSNPPLTGPRVGNKSFVEVRVRAASTTRFMRFFAKDSVDVEALAVAGVQQSTKCIYALSPDKPRAFWAAGNSVVDLGNCGVVVNSSHHNAARTNNGALVRAASIDVVGDYTGNGFLPTPTTGSLPADDPWADLAPPTFTPCVRPKGKITVTEVDTLQFLRPGVYCGGIRVTPKGHAILEPGIYVIYGGGITVNGGGTITGNEVSFYLTGDSGFNYHGVDFNASSVATLSAPKTGAYAGILFHQDRDADKAKPSTFGGKSVSQLTGGMYFPTTAVKFGANAEISVQKLIIVADEIEFHGHASLSVPDIATIRSPYTTEASLVY